ncbi:lysophospholipid acyltransferase family protein [Marinomonas sp. C2222]|uniref:L-ornithine N(alpha)-acyltransferase n=1 Tax=Marinomonas sargassi TaxID=2984494 RepID=A0ABT2YUW8_9GAMM|nr:lysophospholipid acyltransferase family protein [Marinomonas sargassi]MCV2403673.1 lysophospholipid acyltransferase family protein [Marinomonas sargassi]
MINSPFRLPRVTPFGLGESFVEWMTGLSKLDGLYQKRPETETCFDFMRYTLNALNVDYELGSGSTANIPQEGPVVIVANHPLGAIEGVILADLVGLVRKDVKVLANQMLKRLPEISDLFIGVDVFGGKTAKRTNALAIREANQHLADGGVLIIFPAGEVSTYQKGDANLSDIEWRNSVAKFIKYSEATTVPIFINGKNSPLFYKAGKVHPLLRTAMLGRELLNKASTKIEISIGDAIEYSELSGFENEKDLVNYLRLNTYLMSSNQGAENSLDAAENTVAVIEPIATHLLEEEISAIPDEGILHEQGDFMVYCAPTLAIPNLMREIGRIREQSFRAVGEGTGLDCDIDEYDSYYQQLFVWHKVDKQIVGSYRLCMVDKMIEARGIESLYSRSLFNYDQAFIDTLDHSIEVGRSVVAEVYQRNLNSLLLLWKGLATFAYKNPKYTHLFGPVSISNDYSDSARQLMAATLSVHYYDDEKAELVTPSTPLRSDSSVFWQPNLLSALASVTLLSKVLTRMEQGKGLPVLIRQYLKMNGKLVCFNVDPAFHNTLDGLIVVDLRRVPVKTLGKYMGRPEAAEYLESHNALDN